MSRDRFDVLERFAPLFEMPEPSFEAFVRRRDRRRRNQRIAAGVVGIAIFVAAVGLVVVGGSFDRTQTPAAPGPTAVTGPSVPADPVGFGPPPEGAEPSSPEHGELVITFYGRPASEFQTPVLQVLVYADGRVIWRREGGPYGANGILTGFVEQRLTLEGVELLRSEVISSGLFDRDRAFGGWSFFGAPEELLWGEIRVQDGERLVSVRWWGWRADFVDPTPQEARALKRLNDLFDELASMLPASAWEVPEIKAYVPSRYAICYLTRLADGSNRLVEPSEVLNLLPAPAEDLLLGREKTYEPSEGGGRRQVCWEVTTGEARLLAEILGDAGIHRGNSGLTTPALEYRVQAPAPIEEAYIHFEPILPHGQWSLFPG